MARIRIPERFLKKLGPAAGMDLHVVNVKLGDGRVYKNLAVRGSLFITGYANDENGESEVDFDSDDIVRLRRSRFWPLW